MTITEVKIRKLFTGEEIKNDRVRAIVSVTIDGDFAVHELKVIQGLERIFVAMPNRQNHDGSYQDIVHPIGTEARKQLENAVLEAYWNALEEELEAASAEVAK